MTPLPPGGCIGILGGGQLGRMLSMAAAPLGYRCHIFGPEDPPPAGQVADRVTIADYLDRDALRSFAESVDIVTLEFENVPAGALEFLSHLVPVHPGVKALATTQDRLVEKDFANNVGAPTAPYAAVDSLDDLRAAIAKIGPETGSRAVLKTRRMGYDGKGQVMLDQESDLAQAWNALAGAPSILEGYIPFDGEVSVIVARGLDGSVSAYPPIANRHKNHILDTSTVPAGLNAIQANRAIATATDLAIALDYVGVLAVELFVTGDTFLVNEMAPRVHNSGHWSIEGAVTSQFEQHIRAICGLPLGSMALRGQVEMRNLIGDDVDQVPEILAEPGAHLHLYGKAEVRAGRKMGHVTYVKDGSDIT
ncbi:MAG: 5-(carboxyamino)imidazole ribonucleotide synthase [Rhodospirillaceae bacterium]|jgi:5-(carboxyamino)imidazole ribonucleotide synthase|nr:5-(carboxyamino)imidazole ribonucleotide synthase [Rhodospirillaceae bacterium]MBT4686651.1 5-(carboxyamino)imidazole ribonucleotide synthase [Rhodospirillaceae bacterium]MBT5082237.1 5-(carboxyamino)imidazole ribonucleotide synthase [Rhodospirillaceae bacterium]MBT5526756.1 5-(carboxyamino)imidazole ribonucleotide synthase [Rhodospirillaceae bacterium]MBT5879121.1 5-(carboxyamino)imidazole ribonucleotide synthase [Rhodospirillaceae bacterium]